MYLSVNGMFLKKKGVASMLKTGKISFAIRKENSDKKIKPPIVHKMSTVESFFILILSRISFNLPEPISFEHK